MNILQKLLFAIALVVLTILMTLPLWWDAMAPSIFGFPAFVVQEINAINDGIHWLIDQIFK
ncbi:MAG: hypothetical protein M8352_05600 [ANME-2 cluster archaeon]|nr:hypothetical protein [ANME-2 cluster archaeon]MDF1531537.1 hypothetical protein [ANME-2 cluster archaeon]